MPDYEPTAEEIGAAVKDIQQSYKLRRTSESQQLAVEGLLPGVDAPGEVKNGEFHPAEGPQPNYFRDAPWWMIVTLEDLDRAVLGIQGRISALEASKAAIDADIRRQKDRLLRTINYYSDILGDCPATQQSRTVVGPLTRGRYRIQPVRSPQYKLVDRATARATGLLRTRSVEVPASATELQQYAAAHAWTIPGYEIIEQLPVSYTPAGSTPVPEPAELEPAISE
jgi:hypothetical protein